jgi:ribosome biogenesis GTPase A
LFTPFTTIKDTPSVVLCIVDIFDLRGSILPNLRSIVGTNPIVIAANKIDLLPSDVSLLRVQSWIHSEIKQICGYKSPRDGDEGEKYVVGEGSEGGEQGSGELREEDMYFGK